MKYLLQTLLSICLISSFGFGETAQQALTKKRVLSDLENIRNVFEIQYAPLKWKEEYAKWDLQQSFEEAKAKISHLSSPTLKDCQAIVRDFFNSTKDYHVGIRFHSTESASLPFLVKSAKNRYFVVHIDRNRASKREFPFEIGDEILTFGGKPVHEVVQDLRVKEFGQNTFETDQALAEMMLTHRSAETGARVPSGPVMISGKDSRTNKALQAQLTWAYIPEKIQDFSKLGASLQPTNLEWQHDLASALKKSQFFDKFMVTHFWDKSSVNSFLSSNPHSLGSRVSFIPPLGKKVWQSGSDSLFDAYIFKSRDGRNVGYIRIPHYTADFEEVEEFGLLMNYFEARTDALVIDQINNPGGSVFYLYGLVSILTDRPLYAPRHHIALTQDEVHTAVNLYSHLDQIKDDSMARDLFGETVGGYPVDFEFVKLTKQFCQFLINEWNRGKFYTDSTFLFGVDKIKPHHTYNYSKPLLVLINSLDFSGGDFFPAILQDNKRAVLMGTRTAGAGGYVLGTSFPNHSGIRGYLLTGSLAERLDKKPIENLGVTPDIFYELSENDLKDSYKEYKEAILDAVDSLFKKT